MRARYPKYLLRLLGARFPRKQLYGLQAFVNHLKLGRWMRDHGYQFEQALPG